MNRQTDNYNNIPQELKDLPQWVVWGVDNKKLKCPYNPVTMKPAKAGDSSTWGTYEQAVNRVKNGHAQGIGFEFNDNGIYGVDLDKILHDGGGWDSTAYCICQELKSYTEISPSGKGVHILVKADDVSLAANRKDFLEIYHKDRYFTITGNLAKLSSEWEEWPTTIEQRTEELRAIYDRYLKPKPIEPVAKQPVPDYKRDDDYLEAGLKHDETFITYFNGSRPTGNESSDDQGFMNKLAFWCNKNESLMRYTFMNSPYYNGKDVAHKLKCDREDYINRTIQAAIRDTSITAREKDEGYKLEQARKDFTQAPDVTKTLKPRDYTDAGNAAVFSEVYKGKVIFVRALGWLIWNGKKWDCDDLKAVGLAVKLAGNMLKESTIELAAARKAVTFAESTGDPEKVKKAREIEQQAAGYRRHALHTREAPTINRMLDLSKPNIHVKLDRLDANPFALNTPAGLVNLKDGSVMSHDPRQLCANITKVAPNNNSMNIWLDFLDTVTCGDENLKRFLQQVAGMAVVGKVFMESLIIAYGDGRNGKSTFFNAIAAVLSDYAGSIAPEVLTTDKQNKGASLAELKGKRLIIAAELEEGKRLSTSMLKQLASTDPISAERKYKDPESFIPTHSAVLYTNHLPRVGSNDNGTWRRLTLIPFKAKIPANQEVKNFGDELVTKAGGAIMKWIIEGAVMFCNNDYTLVAPEAVKAATEEYRDANDWLGAFIDDRCDIGIGKKERAGSLYSEFRLWAEANGEYMRNNKDFVAEMERQGYESRRDKNATHWYGIELKPMRNDVWTNGGFTGFMG